MASTVLGVISTAVTNTGVNNWQTAGYINGREKVYLDFYVGLGTETAGSTIQMCAPLQNGAKVLYVRVFASAATASLTVSVGDLASATRYASADTGPASKGISTYSGCIDSTNGFYVIGTNPGTSSNLAVAQATGDAQILLTTGGATLGTGTIYGVAVHVAID
jgi:hypothetical protein